MALIFVLAYIDGLVEEKRNSGAFLNLEDGSAVIYNLAETIFYQMIKIEKYEFMTNKYVNEIVIIQRWFTELWYVFGMSCVWVPKLQYIPQNLVSVLYFDLVFSYELHIHSYSSWSLHQFFIGVK